MNSVSVKVTWDNNQLLSIEQKTIRGLMKMGFDIAAQARRNAPYVTGALRNSIRVRDVDSNTVEVIAGGTYKSNVTGKKISNKDVPYAWIREQGPNRNPATEHYMENAKNTIMIGNYMKKYFGDITK